MESFMYFIYIIIVTVVNLTISSIVLQLYHLLQLHTRDPKCVASYHIMMQKYFIISFEWAPLLLFSLFNFFSHICFVRRNWQVSFIVAVHFCRCYGLFYVIVYLLFLYKWYMLWMRVLKHSKGAFTLKVW